MYAVSGENIVTQLRSNKRKLEDKYLLNAELITYSLRK